MLFGDGVGYSALFATHPPVLERIRRIEPRFRPEELGEIAAAWADPVHVDDPEARDASISGFAPARPARPARTRVGGGRDSALPDADARVHLSPNAVSAQVGNPGVDDRRIAQTLHAQIPESLAAIARRQEQVMELVFALLVDADPGVRARQLDLIEQRYDRAVRDAVDRLLAPIAALHPMQRLPLAALAFPALRRRPHPQLIAFMIVLNALIDVDGRTSIEEYCLARLLRIQVIDALNPAARPPRAAKLVQVETELCELFATVARYGHENAEAATRAYLAGMREVLPESTTAYAPPEEWVPALDRALAALDSLTPPGKELVVRGLTRAISDDGVVSVSEAELLRTVCAALHCPLPPLLQVDRSAR
jgi:hypothetical protein